MEKRPLVAIAGTGSGLGAALAHRFARENYDIALLARRKDVTQQLADELNAAGHQARAWSCDLTDPTAVGATFSAIRDAQAAPDILIYNAGAFRLGGLLDIDPAVFHESWKINCYGAFLACREVLPAMVEAGSGTVLLSGATAARRGSAGFASLAVGKFGLRALAQSMAREFGPQGIHVAHVVIDGQIDTPRLREYAPERSAETLLNPYAIAESYWQLHRQHPSAWTLELDLRPSVESF